MASIGRMFYKKNIYLGIVFSVFLLGAYCRYAAMFNEEYRNLFADSEDYDGIAMSVVRGDGFRNELGDLTALRPPLYPYFLAANYLVFGHSLKAVQLSQFFISLVTIVLIGWLAYQIYGRVTGCIAFAIASLYPAFYAYYYSSASILTETLYTFLLVGSVWLVLLALSNKKKSAAIAAGILLGLTVLCRPTPLTILLFLPFFCVLCGYEVKASFRQCCLICFFCLATILPWTIRNYLVFQQLVPVVTSGGGGFYASNHRGSDGLGTKFYGDIVLPEDSRLRAKGWSEPKRSTYFSNLAVNFIRENPADAALLILKKVFLYMDPNITIYKGGRATRQVNWSFILVTLMSFGGVFVGLKNQTTRSPTLLLGVFFVFFLMLHAVVHTSHRYRFPTEPLLIVFAAHLIAVACHFFYFRLRGAISRS